MGNDNGFNMCVCVSGGGEGSGQMVTILHRGAKPYGNNITSCNLHGIMDIFVIDFQLFFLC